VKQTIYKIAKKAEVSIATVSRAMNSETREKVSPETLEKVDAVIRQFGYAPNLAAKGLTQSVFNTIGVIMPHGEGIFLNDYYTRILGGVADSLLDSRYRFKLLMLKCGDPRWNRYDFRSVEGVDGLIITHWHSFFSDKKVLERLDIPFVVINDPEDDVRAHFVSADQSLGGELAAEHLFRYGHRRIAVMTGSPCSVDSRLRLEGFKNFLGERDLSLDPGLTLCGHFQEEKAAVEMDKFLQKKPDFTAIFCLNDAMAFGVIRTLQKYGIKCPGEVSVVGFDDENRSTYCHPPLTSIHVPLYDTAKQATHNLMRFLKKKDKKNFYDQKILLPVELMPRKSVTRVK